MSQPRRFSEMERERSRLNSALTLLPPQDPVILAKAQSTIDWMSSGRLTVTFGVGWLRPSASR